MQYMHTYVVRNLKHRTKWALGSLLSQSAPHRAVQWIVGRPYICCILHVTLQGILEDVCMFVGMQHSLPGPDSSFWRFSHCSHCADRWKQPPFICKVASVTPALPLRPQTLCFLYDCWVEAMLLSSHTDRERERG